MSEPASQQCNAVRRSACLKQGGPRIQPISPTSHHRTPHATPTPHHTLACRGFKALKQIIKIQSRLGNHGEMVEAYRQLLQYATMVTRNAAEKKINSVLDFVSAQAHDNTQLLQVRRRLCLWGGAVGGWVGG